MPGNIFHEFDISPRAYEELFHQGFLVSSNVTKTLVRPVEHFNKLCVLTLKNKRVNEPTANFSIVVTSYCSQSGCYHFRIEVQRPLNDNDPIHVVSYRSGILCHKKVKARQVRGLERVSMAKELQQSSADQIRRREALKLDETGVAVGNLQNCPTLDVLHKIASEHRAKDDLCVDSIEDVVLAKLGEAEGNENIRAVGDPLTVVFFKDAQIQAIECSKASRNEPVIAHLDSTGSIIRKVDNKKKGKKPFYYAMVINIKGQILPICEFFLQIQTANNITYALNIWKDQVVEVMNYWPNLTAVVVDYSYALLQSVSLSFNGVELRDYLQMVHMWLTDDVRASESKLVLIKMCVSHLIKGWKVRIYHTKFENIVGDFKGRKKAKQNFLRMVCTLILQTDYSRFLVCIEMICLITLSKWKTEQVTATIDSLLKQITDSDLIGKELRESEKEDETGKSTGKKKRGKEDTSLYKNSPVYKDAMQCYNRVIGELNKNQTDEKSLEPNVYYCPNFTDYLFKHYVHLSPCWGSYMHKKAGICEVALSNANIEGFIKGRKKNTKKRIEKVGRVIKQFSFETEGQIQQLNLGITKATKVRRPDPMYIPPKHSRQMKNVKEQNVVHAYTKGSLSYMGWGKTTNIQKKIAPVETYVPGSLNFKGWGKTITPSSPVNAKQITPASSSSKSNYVRGSLQYQGWGSTGHIKHDENIKSDSLVAESTQTTDYIKGSLNYFGWGKT